jgi:hypothetical protein
MRHVLEIHARVAEENGLTPDDLETAPVAFTPTQFEYLEKLFFRCKEPYFDFYWEIYCRKKAAYILRNLAKVANEARES